MLFMFRLSLLFTVDCLLRNAILYLGHKSCIHEISTVLLPKEDLNNEKIS